MQRQGRRAKDAKIMTEWRGCQKTDWCGWISGL